MTYLEFARLLKTAKARKACTNLVLMGLIGLFSSGCTSKGPHPDKPHHTNDGFRNIHDYQKRSFFDFLTWQWNRLWKDIPGPAAYHFPLAENDPEFLNSNWEKTTLTWIGH